MNKKNKSDTVALPQQNQIAGKPDMRETTETNASPARKYKAIEPGAIAAEAGGDRSIDFRYVAHGHGACSCCGPYSE